MKRFFCVVCNKVKRVRQWPVMIKDRTSVHVNDRVGECNYHRDTRSHFRMNRDDYERKVAR